MRAHEINFDGLVGPTYFFGGLSYGNIASMSHKKFTSSPKKAAIESLKKMKFLMDLGLVQALFPPQERPNMAFLKNLGFQGKPQEMLKKAAEYPYLLEALSSSAAIWSANSATVIPSSDSYDGKVHFCVANLLNRFHRAIEAEETYRLFQFLFRDSDYFTVHPPLLKGGSFGDEGAANHTRFRKQDGEKGVHLFVYGKSAFVEGEMFFYPARQAQEASQATARRGGLKAQSCVFAKQNPELINLGVFHNDVISVGHQLSFLYHENAFVQTKQVIAELEKKIEATCKAPLKALQVKENMLSVKDAVRTYFFNSQIVTLPDSGQNVLIAPEECRNVDLSWLPFPVYFIDVRQSMKNGGGPACLRLRVELTDKEKEKVHPYIFLNDTLYAELTSWVEKHYRDELSYDDLSDPNLLQEMYQALDALTKILHLDSYYTFQSANPI